MTTNSIVEKNSPKNGTKLIQCTLFNFKKEHEKKIPICTKREFKNLFVDVKPSLFEIPQPFSYSTYLEVLEITEFAHRLSLTFCPDIHIDYANFFDNLLINLAETRFWNNHYELYLITSIFIKSLICIEKLYTNDTKKFILNYTRYWDDISEYLSYSTVSEFVRILVHACTYKPRSAIEKTFLPLIYVPEFFSYTLTHKLMILHKLYDDVLRHHFFSRKINEQISIPNIEKLTFLKTDQIDPINEREGHETARASVNQHDISNVTYRGFPMILNNDLFLWETSCSSRIIVEDPKKKVLYYYENSHLFLLNKFRDSLKKKNKINRIICLLNKPQITNDYNAQEFDLKESAKKNLCILIEKSLRPCKNLQYFEKKLLKMNKLFPKNVLSWVNFLSEFTALFWPHIRKWKNIKLTRSPFSHGHSLYSYITKIKSWSALCLGSEIVTRNFAHIPEFRILLKTHDFNEHIKSTRESSSDEDLLKCNICERDENSSGNSRTMHICRSCRLDQRNKAKATFKSKSNNVLKKSSYHNVGANNSIMTPRASKRNASFFDFDKLRPKSSTCSKLQTSEIYKRKTSSRFIISSDSD